ncbi:MAG: transcriptional regulator [Planctomycetes bacterium SM23_25]|nr:MAG: transcriptional regulator [Planctomycetes bacterium DG_20]KPK42881.1 MAG: transcriptional regulator [Planctomycetes bacterium SM23_25]
MAVPLLDLVAQYGQIRDEVRAAVDDVLESQHCIGGPKVTECEKAVAEYSDCRFGIGASSGTDAILNALMSLEIGAGDEVITTPFTFFATAGCIVRTGARPVFVDIDPKTYNIDPALIEAAVTDRTRAIMPVHLFGQTADMDPMMEVALARGLAVVEDAAQAVGATYKGRKAGSMGTAGCFSFFPSKNLGGVGDGGMVVTNDAHLAEQCTVMRNHGSKPKYYHKYVGGNFRLDAIQAAVITVKLKYLEQWHEARRANAAYYDERFAPCEAVVTPYVEAHNRMIYNQYVIRIPDGNGAPPRDQVVAHLDRRKIGHAIYYPVPLHLQECFADLGYQEGDLPESEKASREVLAIPIYPELSQAQQDEVADAVLEAVGG